MLKLLSDEQNSGKSLESLVKVNENINQRKFHNHTYILYDIRTILGDQEKTYLEIGSYVGSSASLLLNHPYKTNIFCIDPCILSPDHYNGSSNQYHTLYNNLKKSNIYNNFVKIYRNYSTDSTLLHNLKEQKITTDILFIDGDNSYDAVIQDWNNFKGFVNVGGFIVFDDYNDEIYSPQVKPAVQEIVKNIDLNEFEIIGDLDNVHELDVSNPNYLHKNKINEFIIYKKHIK
jgi:predicted O-methyltransferase YrrM